MEDNNRKNISVKNITPKDRIRSTWKSLKRLNLLKLLWVMVVLIVVLGTFIGPVLSVLIPQ